MTDFFLKRIIKIFFIIFLNLIYPVNSFSQDEDSLYYLNPDYHVAKELFSKRIVMLGDYGHHQPGPYKHVLNTLDNWLTLCLDKDTTINLTLVLEIEENDGDEITSYLRSGSLKDYLDKFDPEFYLEHIDFYSNLRKFYLKVDSLNKIRQNQINFTVKGFEEVGKSNQSKVAMMNNREWYLWFVNERDSTTSKGLIN